MDPSWAEAINQRNEEFWAARNREMRQRLTIRYLVSQASELVEQEDRPGLAIEKRHSFEGALEVVELRFPRLFKIIKGHAVPALTEDLTAELAGECVVFASADSFPEPGASLAAALAAEARARGKRGGQAAKADAVTRAIRTALLADLSLSQSAIFHRLKAMKIILESTPITGNEIEWRDDSGRLRRTTMGGFKDRIYRARKALKNEGYPRSRKRPRLNASALRLINSLSREAA